MKIIVTTTTRNPSPLKPPLYFPDGFPIFKLPNTIAVFPNSRAPVAVKCSENGGSLKDLLSGMVDERVEQLLNKEENKGLLEGLEQASLRVENAKRELAEIEKQEMEAKIMRDYIDQLESRASQTHTRRTRTKLCMYSKMLIDFRNWKIAECQKEILEAKAMVEEAEVSLKAASNQVTNKDEERLQSVKAASISAVVGTLAELPISLSRVTSNSELILPLAITVVSCALFGVTFRYAIRRDLDNFQLKSGTSVAFGFVKGLGMLESGALQLDAGSILAHAFDGAVYVSESLLIFLFAGVALDFCMKMRILSPFPIEESI